MMRAWTSLAAFFSLGAITVGVAPGSARADTPPNIWDIAKDPAARARYQLHVMAREAIVSDGALPQIRSAVLERARGMLEFAHAEASPDVRLRFDLGEIYEQLSDHLRAVAVLGPAIEEAPDHPAAEDAILSLAYAHAKLDRAKDERDDYLRYLAHVTNERSRTTALLNMAEAEMRLGNMPDAVAGYRDATQAADALPTTLGTWKTAILARWGLAVALDRSGDPAGAAAEATLAAERDHGNQVIGDKADVFFVPDYERSWYFALGAVARAAESKDPRQAQAFWRTAESEWSSYVTSSEHAEIVEHAKDRWLPLARAHLEHARLEKLAAEKRIPSGSRPIETEEDALRRKLGLTR